jgi:hypothetical protein
LQRPGKLVATSQAQGENDLNASHCAAPMIAPAIRPPTRAVPTVSILPTSMFAA